MPSTHCPQCGSQITEGAAACASCGARACRACGSLVDHSRRFCTSCGEALIAPAVSTTAATTAPAPLTAPQIGAIAGFAMAVVATMLTWVSVPFESGISGWSGKDIGGYRVSDWLSAYDSPLDPIFILVLAGLGVWGVLSARKTPRPAANYAVAGLGSGLALLGILEFFYINEVCACVLDLSGEDLDPGLGVYLLALGGLTSGIAGFRMHVALRQAAPAAPSSV